VRHVVIDLEAVTDADVTAAESFAGLVAWLDEQGVSLSFSRLRAGARPRLERLGILTDQHVFDTNRRAVEALEARADHASTSSAPREKGHLHE
jgi:anti-anti-sigma regulatory factor